MASTEKQLLLKISKKKIYAGSLDVITGKVTPKNMIK